MEGSDYEFRVIAENYAGQGKPVLTHQPVQVKSPYGKCDWCHAHC